MSKVMISVLTVLILGTSAFGKSFTVKGTYVNSECGDYCYMTFKTKNGDISPIGDPENYPNLKKGQVYTVTYDEKMEFIPEANQKIKIQVIKSIK